MAKIFGREQEQRQLQERVNSNQAEFVAIYGRRRVGKTFLIREYFNDSFAFYVSGTLQGDAEEQKKVFRRALQEYGSVRSNADNWLDLFFELEDMLKPKVITGEKCVLFIDELPCFDTVHSGFLNALDHFWNTWASRYGNVKLFVCGSATSWMITKLINNRGGLHNRLTGQMYLHPFTLNETEKYLQSKDIHLDREMIVEAYMAFGGIPYYLNMLQKDESFAQTIDRVYFAPNAFLQLEFNRLFASLFNSPEPYIEIIKVLSVHKQGLTRDEIATALHTNTSGRLSVILQDMVYCDFIRPYYVRKKSKVSKRECIYALTDMFSLFHLHFANKTITNPTFWENKTESSAIKVWQGLAFEQVVMHHIPQLKAALGISGIAVEYYSWRSKKTEPKSQIDLILDRADRIVNICEIKYSHEPYLIDKDEAMKLKLRTQNFLYETDSHQTTHLTFITPYGLRPNQYALSVVKSLTSDDLFR